MSAVEVLSMKDDESKCETVDDLIGTPSPYSRRFNILSYSANKSGRTGCRSTIASSFRKTSFTDVTLSKDLTEGNSVSKDSSFYIQTGSNIYSTKRRSSLAAFTKPKESSEGTSTCIVEVNNQRKRSGGKNNSYKSFLPAVKDNSSDNFSKYPDPSVEESVIFSAPPNFLNSKKQISGNLDSILKPLDEHEIFTSRLRQLRKIHSKSSPIVGPPAKNDVGKITLVLDVDETLIHSRIESPYGNSKMKAKQDQVEESKHMGSSINSCEEFDLILNDGELVKVTKRPGLDSFLKYVGERYEVMAYTAGLEQYAAPLLNWLDPEGKIFRYRLYRDSCLFVKGYYVKDLSKVNRVLSRTVLVDNNFYCFLPQIDNGIPIVSFYDDPFDNALDALKTFLNELESAADVREPLKKRFDMYSTLKDVRTHIFSL